MCGEVPQEDGVGFAVDDDGPMGDVRLFGHPYRVGGDAGDEYDADGSTFDDEVLEKRKEVDGHLGYSVMDEEPQRLFALILPLSIASASARDTGVGMRCRCRGKSREMFQLEAEFRTQVERVYSSPPVWVARELVRLGTGGIVERGEFEEVRGGKCDRGRQW